MVKQYDHLATCGKGGRFGGMAGYYLAAMHTGKWLKLVWC